MLPDVITTIQDGALGMLPTDTDGIGVLLGAATGGVVNTLYSVTDIDGAKAAVTGGKLVEAAANHISASGKPVYLMRVTSSVAGSIGAITKVGTGPTITAAGTTTDDAQPRLTIVTGGALGAGVFKYSLDGGDTYSANTVIPSGGTFVLPDTGVTLTFPAGTYVAGDTYSFDIVGPGFSSADLNAAIDALLADPREWGFVHVVGAATTAAGAATIAAALDAKLETARLAHRYAFGVIEVADDTDPAFITAFANFTSTRVFVAPHSVELVSPATGRINKRSSAWPVVARAAKVPISEDLGRLASGPLTGVVSLYRDERKTPGLDDARFLTLRTIIGAPGFHVTNPRMFAPPTSDFRYLQYRRIMDHACKVARNGILRFLNETLLVNPVGHPRAGGLVEGEARNIETYVGGQLAAALVAPGHASAASILVVRTDNNLTTQKVRVKVRVTPPAYAKTIEMEIGFTNPALQIAA